MNCNFLGFMRHSYWLQLVFKLFSIKVQSFIIITWLGITDEGSIPKTNVYFWSIKNSSEVIKMLRLRNFQGSDVFSFDFLLYTHSCHRILSKQKCCLLFNRVSTESPKHTTVLQIKRDFSPTRHMARIHVKLAPSYEKLLLSSWKMYYMCNMMAWCTNI